MVPDGDHRPKSNAASGEALGPAINLRVALVHDWLVKYGGAERCLDELLELYPGSSLYTLLLDRGRVAERYHHAQPSPLQRLPGALKHHELLLPLMPAAWQLRAPIRGVDVVVSSSYACAKAVRVASGIPHVCYCHSPMRYAWDFEVEKGRLPAPVRPPAGLAMRAFRRWDRAKAANVRRFVANSTAVARRIRSFYGRDSTVVFPPVRTSFFTPGGDRSDEFLFVSRLVSFKRPDLVVEAFRGLPYGLNVVGDGRMRQLIERGAPPNVRFSGWLDDVRLREAYRAARALVHPGVDDFGIVMAEAQACGIPVIATAEGGAVDIVADGQTGWLVKSPTVESIRRAVLRAAGDDLDPTEIRARAERFSEDRFRLELHAIVLEEVGG